MNFALGLRPVAENFKYFALVPAGLALGFPNGQIAGLACGRIEVTVPYGQITPYLSSLSRVLVSETRKPVSSP
jgi:hypothetical protein